MTSVPVLRARPAGTIVVIAKAPVPGRSKTRLCPPCTPDEAARLAQAALEDTLAAVLATPARRRVLALDGRPGPWLPPGFEVIVQRGGGLDERLAAAFADTGAPAVLIGMDTPQVTPRLLRQALRRLSGRGTDAVLGLAADGGWWAIGLRIADSQAFIGVPMSTAHTGAAQIERLRSLGLRVALLPRLRDVDEIEDAYAVAALAPGSRFATLLAGLALTRAPLTPGAREG